MKIDLLMDMTSVSELSYDNPSGTFMLNTIKGSFQRSYNDEIVITTSDYTLKDNDRLYFYKGCNILRDKIRSFAAAENNGINITIKPENSDARFVGNDTINFLLDSRSSGYSIKRQDIISLLNTDKDQYNEILTELYNISDEIILLDWRATSYLRDMNDRCKIHQYLEYTYTNVYKIENEELYDEMCQFVKNGGILYDDASLVKIINKSLDALDKEAFEQIELMLLSSDEDNISLAAEMMANSDPIGSGYYLAYFLNRYYNKLKNQSGRWNAVNFKSMREMFPDFEYKETLDIINYACENNLVKDDNLEIVKTHLLEAFSEKLDHRFGNLLKIEKKSLGDGMINSIKYNRVLSGAKENLTEKPE